MSSFYSKKPLKFNYFIGPILASFLLTTRVYIFYLQPKRMVFLKNSSLDILGWFTMLKRTILAIIFCTFSSVYASDKAKALFNQNSSKVVLVASKHGLGTGFFISPEIILTNRHVLFGFDSKSNTWNAPEKITLKDGREITAFPNVVCSKRVDLCAIPVASSSLKKIKPTSINIKVVAGDDVFIIGHPKGLNVPIISTGVISSEIAEIYWPDINEKPITFKGFMTNAAISHGSSGSPVFSRDGELLGLAVGGHDDSQNLNIIISSMEINVFISQIARGMSEELVVLKPGFDIELDEYTKKQMSKNDNNLTLAGDNSVSTEIKTETNAVDSTENIANDIPKSEEVRKEVPQVTTPIYPAYKPFIQNTVQVNTNEALPPGERKINITLMAGTSLGSVDVNKYQGVDGIVHQSTSGVERLDWSAVGKISLKKDEDNYELFTDLNYQRITFTSPNAIWPAPPTDLSLNYYDFDLGVGYFLTSDFELHLSGGYSLMNFKGTSANSSLTDYSGTNYSAGISYFLSSSIPLTFSYRNRNLANSSGDKVEESLGVATIGIRF